MKIFNETYSKSKFHHSSDPNDSDIVNKVSFNFIDAAEEYEIIIYKKELSEVEEIIDTIKSLNSFEEIISKYPLKKVQGSKEKLNSWVL